MVTILTPESAQHRSLSVVRVHIVSILSVYVGWDQIVKCWVKLFSRIVRAQGSDVAVYTCVASNRAGVDNKHYSLQVLGTSPTEPWCFATCLVSSSRLVSRYRHIGRDWSDKILPTREEHIFLPRGSYSFIGAYCLFVRMLF